MITLVASGESVLKVGSLERLRGVAALFTVGAHLASYSSVDSTWFALTSRGWAGVDLFFVISGCVVTLSLSRKTGFSGWLLFLVRRFFRIFPMAFVAVVLTCASTWWVALVWHGAIDLASFHEELKAVALGVYNFRFARKGPGLFGPFWSLAVEEQFYLFYPFLYFSLPKKARTAVFVALAFGTALFLRFNLMGWLSVDPAQTWRRMMTPFSLDGLLLGSAIGCAVSEGWFPRPRTSERPVRGSAGVARGFLILVAFAFLGLLNWLPDFGLGYALILDRTWTASLVSSGLVLTALQYPDEFLGTWAPIRIALNHTGARSYSLYVLHMPVFRVLELALKKWGGGGIVAVNGHGARAFALGALMLVPVFVVSEFTYRWVELPLVRYGRRRFQPNPG